MDYGHLDELIVKKYRFPKKGYAVDVEALAKELGLRVEVTDLSPEISGSLMRDGEHYVIKVKSGEPKGRQKFTMAHELGHYALHRDIVKDGIQEDIFYRSDKMGDKQEQEANAFAADLIMPRKKISEAIKNHSNLEKKYGMGVHDDYEGDGALEILARAFGVSKIAMSIRMNMPA